MIKKNLQQLKDRIDKAASKVGRNPMNVKLVAVSKRFPVHSIIEAHQHNQVHFGENYIQEVQDKSPDIPKEAMIHFIGHLQSNKAKAAATHCDMIETVDRLKLGKALNKHLVTLEKTIDILIQVNIGEDPQKAGVAANQAEDLLVQLNQLTNLRVCGLMTMPPQEENPEQSRPHFRNLRQLAQKLQDKHLFKVEKPELSMGMSADFEIAIEEGATIIRVGTAIFGARQK